MPKTIRVVAADDSAVMRSLLISMFATEQAGALARMELCAMVPDGTSCLEAVRALRPDIVLMDLHMPGLGGMESIALLRREWPRLPIILCSAYTEAGAGETLDAFARGASDYVTKPSGHTGIEAAITSLWTQLVPKIIAWTSTVVPHGEPDLPAPSPLPRQAFHLERGSVSVIGIGASTGGPMALEALLPRLPADFAAPILVVQHMPKLFTKALAERLDRCCALRVREAVQGTLLHPGTIWLAPGDSHMEVTSPSRSSDGATRLVLHQGPSVQHCRPSVDVLFRSLAARFTGNAVGVVLTGMGSDGLDGSRSIVKAGGVVLAQDEASSAVWGMPGRVVGAGLARAALPLQKIADALIALASPAERRGTVPLKPRAIMPEVRRDLY